jgi:uncharacterized protein (DUF305 family)
MSRRTIGLVASGLLLSVLLLGGAGVALAGRPNAVTNHRGTMGGPLQGSGPFMGIANPAAPYDQRFLDEMIVHHQGAIMSAEMMIGRSARPRLRDLAHRIITGQQQQIHQMRAWRQQWYPHAGPLPMDMGPMIRMMGMMGGGMMGGSNGMMGGSMMGGTQVNRMFLRMMIPHHQLAIDMAQDALTNAQHPALKGLAQAIIRVQSAEITEMEGYLKTWYGEGTTRDLAGPMRALMQRLMGGITR